MRFSLSSFLMTCSLFLFFQACLFDTNDEKSRDYIVSITVDKVIPIDQIEVTKVIDGDTTLLIFTSETIQKTERDSTHNSYKVSIPLSGKSSSPVMISYVVKSKGVIVLTNNTDFTLGGDVPTSTQQVDTLVIDLLKQYHRKKQLINENNANNSDSTHLEKVRTFNSHLFSALAASRMRDADSAQVLSLYNAYKSNEKNIHRPEFTPDTLRLLSHIRDTLSVYSADFPKVLGRLYPDRVSLSGLLDSIPGPRVRDPLNNVWQFPIGAKGIISAFQDTILKITIIIVKENSVLDSFTAVFDTVSNSYSVKAGISQPGTYSAELHVTSKDSLLTGLATIQFTEKDTLLTFPEISALNAEPWVTIAPIAPLSIFDSTFISATAGDSIGGQPVSITWSIDSLFHDISVPFVAPAVPNDSQQVVVSATDSDGNTVFASIMVSVLLDPPTVTLATPDSIIDLADSIKLSWIGSDLFGSIVQYSVRPIEGATIVDWIDAGLDSAVTFEHLTTDGVFSYMVRAMDDDGNVAFDTVTITKLIDPPHAQKVAIVGTAAQNGTLKVMYTYSDVLGDLEGATQFQWFRGTDSILGAIDSLYTPVYADSGAVLSCLVTPVALTGYQTVGTGILGVVTGQVTGFNAPVVDSVSIIGSLEYTTEHTVSYVYSDSDGDAEGASVIQWLRNASAIVGANDSSYTPTADDVGQTLSVSVTPVSVTGTVLSGIPQLSEERSITGQLPVPQISLVGGIFTEAQDVTISHSLGGASIHYTLDGSDPDIASPIYAAALTISASTTLRTRLIKTGWISSPVVFQSYTITGTVADPVLSVAAGSYASAQPVEITSATPGAEIRYTTDGSDPTVVSQRYIDAVAITTSQTLRARAFKINWLPSTIIEAEYIILGTVSLPVISPIGGTYTAAISVTLSSNIDQSEIYYTTDGSEPTKSATLYTTPFEVAASATVQARAYRNGWVESSIVSQSYVITGTVATPTVDNVGGTYTAPITVVLNATTPGAVIKYTTDGTIPIASSPVYTSALPIASTTTLTARAFKADWIDSEVMTHTYTITGTLSAPTVDTPGHTSTTPVTVSPNTGTPKATIRYTTDLSEPDESSPIFTSLLISSTTTLKLRSYKSGWIQSSVKTEIYTITGSLALPLVSESGGTYTSERSISLTNSNNSAIIYYTLDGTEPTESDTEYTSPITISSTTTLRARAFLNLWTPSTISSHTYIITGQVTTPQITPAATTHSTPQTITIGGVNVGAVLYYTTDDSEPTQSSTIYSSPFSLTKNATIKARAYLTDWDPSAIKTVSYELITPTPTLSHSAGTYQAPITVSLSGASGTSLYCTQDGSTPSASSTPYTAPISVTTTRTIRCIALRSGWSESTDITSEYTITGTVQAPTINLSGGQYSSEQSITVTPQSGSTVYYTTDGSAPTESDTEVTGAIAVTRSNNYRFGAFRSGWTPSSIVNRNYELIVPTPSATAATTAATSISVSASTSMGTLRMTASSGTPSDPTGSSTPYSAPFSVTSTKTYKFKAFKTGWTSSPTITRTYTINGQAAAPTVTSSREAATSIGVTASGTGTIRYTFSATATPANPSASSTVWTNRTITASNDGNYKFIVTRTNYTTSTIITRTYTINGQASPPTATNSTSAASSINVTASGTGTIRYTFSATATPANPSASSTVWSNRTITASNDGNYKFIVTRANYTTSTIITRTYTINGQASPPTATNSTSAASSINVTASGTGTIRYTFSATGTPSNPTASSTVWSNTTITSSNDGTYKFAITRDKYLISNPITRTYTINGKASPPTATNSTYAASYIHVAASGTGTVRYTYSATGSPSNPTASSYVWTNRTVTSGNDGIYKFVVTRSNYLMSNYITRQYIINGQAAPPNVTGSREAATSINVTASGTGTIRYTFSDTATPSNPTASSPVWSNKTINASNDGTYKFIVIRSNYTPSSIITRRYTINGRIPTPSISYSQISSTRMRITISETSGATTWFNIDDGTFVEYTGPITMTCPGFSCMGLRTIHVKAYSTRTNWVNSYITSRSIRL